jgi:hypothetical protein
MGPFQGVEHAPNVAEHEPSGGQQLEVRGGELALTFERLEDGKGE